LLTPVAIAATSVASQSPAPAPAPIAISATPASAAPFEGDWVLTADGANGPATFALTVKAEAGKVVAEISSAAMPKQVVTDISTVGPALLLRYAFDYQGMAIPVSLTLTPADGKIAVHMDFADGAYQMVGGATKKEVKEPRN
jgi:hypothetical protein